MYRIAVTAVCVCVSVCVCQSPHARTLVHEPGCKLNFGNGREGGFAIGARVVQVECCKLKQIAKTTALILYAVDIFAPIVMLVKCFPEISGVLKHAKHSTQLRSCAR